MRSVGRLGVGAGAAALLAACCALGPAAVVAGIAIGLGGLGLALGLGDWILVVAGIAGAGVLVGPVRRRRRSRAACRTRPTITRAEETP